MSDESPLNTIPPSSNPNSIKPISSGEGGPKPGNPMLPGEEGPASFALKQQDKVSNPSPMDINAAAQKSAPLQAPTIPNLLNQTTQIAQSLQSAQDEIKTRLNTLPENSRDKAQVSASNAALLQNYLNRISENTAIIGKKINASLPPTNLPSTPVKGIAHYLNYIAGSQIRLKELTNALSHSKNLSPGDLLAVQVKMNGIQQQVEFFTVLLGKALSDISTVMQIQN